MLLNLSIKYCSKSKNYLIHWLKKPKETIFLGPMQKWSDNNGIIMMMYSNEIKASK